MSSLKTEIEIANLTKIKINDESIIVDFDDGRTISLPTSWYPRLQYGSQKERDNYHMIGNGEGIHWPDLDEDISIEGLISGIRSHESQASLQNWLKARKK
ncbi:MAG: DUF2442 domain-containing protein [Spirochaetales bacterium]|nr:DUF2442 domain-containing protein [Spirochaetales bacterium]